MISSKADFRFKLQKELQYSNHASEWDTNTLFYVFQHYGMKFENWQELTSERQRH